MTRKTILRVWIGTGFTAYSKEAMLMCGLVGIDPAELLRRAQGGENDALGRLLEIYRNYLLLLARLHIDQRLRGKVDASDAVQDVFLEAHRAFGQFQGSTEQELLTWLRHIFASRLADQARRFLGAQCRDVRLERQLDEEFSQSSQMVRALAPSKSSPSRSAVRREQVVLLADALKQLPADYREVIILHHLESLPFPEVAQRMGRSIGAVEKLWMRALSSLRQLLEEQTDGSR